jgi:hypothetical protein
MVEPQSRLRRRILEGRSTWPSRICGAPSFVNGCHLRARNDDRIARYSPLRNLRSNDMIYHAAGERRTTSSWHGCSRGSDGIDLPREDDVSRLRLPGAAICGGLGAKPGGSPRVSGDPVIARAMINDRGMSRAWRPERSRAIASKIELMLPLPATMARCRLDRHLSAIIVWTTCSRSFELDFKNRGKPYIAWLASLKRFVMRVLRHI